MSKNYPDISDWQAEAIVEFGFRWGLSMEDTLEFLEQAEITQNSEHP